MSKATIEVKIEELGVMRIKARRGNLRMEVEQSVFHPDGGIQEWIAEQKPTIGDTVIVTLELKTIG